MFWQQHKKLLTDAHCHYLDYVELPDKIYPSLCVTTRPEQFDEAQKLALRFPQIRPSLGLFPLSINDLDKDLLAFKSRIEKTRFIGEVGLDFSVDEREKQIFAFSEILKMTDKNNVFSLHSRRSAEQVFEMIEGHPGKFVFHWYSGPIDLMMEASENIYFSLNPAMISSRQGKEIFKKVDISKILLESDAPYVEMQNNKGTELATRVIDSLSLKRKLSAEDLLKKTQANFEQLFGTT